MIEDDAYRMSSQYRIWSFTPAQLKKKRAEVNQFASERNRTLFDRARAGTPASSTNGSDEGPATTTFDPLTPEEELVIVRFGCERILEMKDIVEPPPSSIIIATAIQFLRRFYLVNSPMTYHPKNIMVCCLLLAMKAEHVPISVARLASYFQGMTAEQVLAPEFMLLQSLKFTLDVRHPIDSLDGTRTDLRERAADLNVLEDLKVKEREARITKAVDKARVLLTGAAQLTDVYFLYTPPQICLAALYITDKQLTHSYVNQIFDRLGSRIGPIKQKLFDTITRCAELLSTASTTDNKAYKRVGKKLAKCQDPEKVDMVAVAAAKAAEKRAGHSTESDSEMDEEKRERKKQKKEKTVEGDGEVFGGELKSVKKS